MKKQVCIWPIGCVALEKLKKNIPAPRKFYGEWDGDRFIKMTRMCMR